MSGLFLAGCGAPKPKAETLVQASGTVKLDGRPVEGVRLAFHPADNNKPLGGCWGITDKDGKYTVMHISNKPGIPAGAYHVTFSRYVKPDGSPLGPKDSPTTTMSSESIAPKWSNVANVNLHNKVDIPAKGSTSLDFNVSTAPQKK